MDVAPIAAEPIPWQSVSASADTVGDMFAVGVSSTTAMLAGTDESESWADFGGGVTSSASATAVQSSVDSESDWADFASFDTALQSQSCSTR